MGERDWIRGQDREVRIHLQAQLARAKGKHASAVLGVTPGAPAAEARRAFLDATKSYHPTRFARRADDIRELANEMFLLVKEAYESLSQGAVRRPAAQRPTVEGSATASVSLPKTPPASAAPPRPVDATTLPLYRDAMSLCDRGEFSAAREILQQLDRQHPNNSKIQARLHFAAGAEQAGRGRLRRAVQELNRALAIDPSFEAAKQILARVAAGQLGGGR